MQWLRCLVRRTAKSRRDGKPVVFYWHFGLASVPCLEPLSPKILLAWHPLPQAVCNSQSEIDFRESSKTVVVWQKTILRILTPWREGRAAKPHVLYFPPKPTQSCHGRVAKPHHLDRKVLYKTKTCVILPCRPVQLRVICHDFSFCLFVCFHETAFKCIRYVRYCLTCNPYNGSESQYKRSQQIHSASRNDVSMTTSCPVPPVIWQFSKSRIMVHEILSSFLF